MQAAGRPVSSIRVQQGDRQVRALDVCVVAQARERDRGDAQPGKLLAGAHRIVLTPGQGHRGPRSCAAACARSSSCRLQATLIPRPITACTGTGTPSLARTRPTTPPQRMSQHHGAPAAARDAGDRGGQGIEGVIRQRPRAAMTGQVRRQPASRPPPREQRAPAIPHVTGRAQAVQQQQDGLPAAALLDPQASVHIPQSATTHATARRRLVVATMNAAAVDCQFAQVTVGAQTIWPLDENTSSGQSIQQQVLAISGVRWPYPPG